MRRYATSLLQIALLLSAGAPAFSASLVSEANALAAGRQYRLAVEKYKLAIENEPNNAAAHHMFGRTLALMGLIPRAIEEYRLAAQVRKTPDAELENDLGVALAANDELIEAALHLKRATTLNPKFAGAYNNLGVALERLGDFAAASQAFTMSLKLQPTNKYIEEKLSEVSRHVTESKHFDFVKNRLPAPSASEASADTSDAPQAPVSVTPAVAPRTGVPVTVFRPAPRKDGGNAPLMVPSSGHATKHQDLSRTPSTSSGYSDSKRGPVMLSQPTSSPKPGMESITTSLDSLQQNVGKDVLIQPKSSESAAPSDSSPPPTGSTAASTSAEISSTPSQSSTLPDKAATPTASTTKEEVKAIPTTSAADSDSSAKATSVAPTATSPTPSPTPASAPAADVPASK